MTLYYIDEWIRWSRMPGGKVLIYHAMECAYYEFEQLSAALFIGLASGKDVDHALRSIAETYSPSVSKAQLSTEAARFTDILVSKGILRVKDSATKTLSEEPDTLQA